MTGARPGTRVAIACALLFAAAFVWLQLSPEQWGLIHLKTLRSYDESLNATVAANLARDVFPPAVRLNPVVEHYTSWLEGPLWQHIPPLFLYVPLPFFWLTGGPSVEGFRLSYALVELLTGVLFIGAVAAYTRSMAAAGCAAVAAWIWARSPFTMALVSGERFGVSDTVLAFSTTVALSALLFYLARRETGLRPWQYALIGLAAAFPMMVKHLLGAIPAATLLGLMLLDRRRGLGVAVLAGGAALALYYGILYLSSPETFRAGFGVALRHVGADYEGWARPWHFFLTDYLPNQYLPGLAWVVFVMMMVVSGCAIAGRNLSGRRLTLAWLTGGWFLWNLVAISLVTAKAPNFIFQTYLFGVFVALYVPVAGLSSRYKLVRPAWLTASRAGGLAALLAIATVGSLGTAAYRLQAERALPYTYDLPLEKVYHVAERARHWGWTPRDLVLFKLTDPAESPPPNDPAWFIHHRPEEASYDYWGRYAFMFLTGAETWLYDDFRRLPLTDPAFVETIRRKYDRIQLVIAQEKPWPPIPARRVRAAVQEEGIWVVTIWTRELPDLAFIPRLPPHPHPLAPHL